MKPSSETNSVANEPYRLGTWARIYLHGFIASVVAYGLAYVVMLLYQLTFGSVSPNQIRDDMAEE